MAVRWDQWKLVDEALNAAKPELADASIANSLGTPRLVVVAFADKWSKPAMAMAQALEHIRMGRDVEVGAATHHTRTRPQVAHSS